jgi:hypothetical protein
MKFTVVFALATLVATISAHGDVVGVHNTNVGAEHVVDNVLNNADVSHLGQNLNADVLSHIASVDGDINNNDGNSNYGSEEDSDGDDEEYDEEDDQEEETEEDDQEDDQEEETEEDDQEDDQEEETEEGAEDEDDE